jgi:hypothetical protein
MSPLVLLRILFQNYLKVTDGAENIPPNALEKYLTTLKAATEDKFDIFPVKISLNLLRNWGLF